MEVRREDQEKINKFSSLHQKETSLEEELRAKIVSATPPCYLLSSISYSCILPLQQDVHCLHCKTHRQIAGQEL